MKLIHCADIHLDAKMNTHLDKEKAKERKAELLHTFVDMVDYGEKEGVSAILIAGDLFDTSHVGKRTAGTVLDTIKKHPAITFFYLKGNHDSDDVLLGEEEAPDNLKTFSDTWTTYTLSAAPHITLTGCELSDDNGTSLYDALLLDPAAINLVMLHGQENASVAKDKAEVIPLNKLQNKNIDYLALGHVHSYKKEKIDGRGVYCYSGCLEGRGFDECGEKGFVLVEIDTAAKEVNTTFVPFAKRYLYEVAVDVTGLDATLDMQDAMDQALAEASIDPKHLVKVILTGSLDLETEIDLEFLTQHVAPDYYYAKVKDGTTLRVDYDAYAKDASLKGEFIRLVQARMDLSEEEKGCIIRYGVAALMGGDLA